MEGAKKIENEKKFLQKILGKSAAGTKIISLDVSAACNVGENFMSNVFRYKVSLQDSNNNIEAMNLLMKKLPSNEVWKETFGCELAFTNEATSYNDIIPNMNKFRGEDNFAVPRCYHASSDCTLLQDLKPLGYKMVARQLGLDLSHAKLVLKELGKFHGTSLAMKHAQPELFENMRSKIQEITFRPESNGTLAASILNSTRMAAVGLKLFRAIECESIEPAIKKIKDLKQSGYWRLLQTVQQRGPLSVICHGDLHLNNIMFKYTESGEVSKVMLIDLQSFRYSSLALDLLYFLNSSLRPGVVASNIDELMETYRQSLNEQLDMFAPTAPRVSLKAIQDELRTHSTYGLLMGFLVLPFLTALPENGFDFEKEEEVSPQDYFQRGLDMLSPEYFIRIKQIVKDYVTLGFL